LQAAEEVSKLEFNEFKERVDDTAIEAIKEEKIWEIMKKKCDEIGYCGFTPEI
jgi:hypothetical protein